jgi:phage terminase large subunit GpA-like protein
MTVDTWADTYLTLPNETSAERGPYRTSRTPYVIEPMRELSSLSPTRRVVAQWGAQTGKTTLGLAWIGYTMHLTPCAMMFVMPTIDMAEDASKERIAPLIEHVPVLAERALANKSRNSDSTIRRKKFHGGFLKISGANSAVSLRSTPIKNLFLDEIDAYPDDVDGEGSPIKLAEKRAATFRRGKKLYTSTPGLKDHSAIEKLMLQSDQRRYFVPCPHCGHFDTMRWENIDYRNDDPETVTLLCVKCGVLIEEGWKTQMLDRGEWRPTAKGDGRTVGFHLNALYSPLGMFSWKDAVYDWLQARKDPSQLKTFINTVLAETYEDRADTVEPEAIFARRETYAAEVPDGVGAIVASVDVQSDRLEYQVKGYGAGEESWLLEWGAVPGDPTQGQVWLDLDARLTGTWEHASGRKLRVECVAVDSAYKPDRVYEFCKARAHRRVFAVIGTKEWGKPLLGRPRARNSYRTRVYPLCVNAGKETVHSRLRIAKPGIGYMHLPEGIDREYVDQLTGEKLLRQVVKTAGGRHVVTKWSKIRDRNEALDLEVYCLAALHILLGPQAGRLLRVRAAKYSTRPDGSGPPGSGGAPAPAPSSSGTSPAAPKPAQPAQRPQRPWLGQRRRGWVQGWRR